MHWLSGVFRAVSDWRGFLGIEGQATNRDAWALLEAVGGLTVEWESDATPYLWMEGERGVITLCPSLSDEERTGIVLHEIGHWLFRHNPFYLHSTRGIRLSDGKHESPATAFRDLWLLAGVDGVTDEEVAAEAGCPVEQVSHYRSLLLKVA